MRYERAVRADARYELSAPAAHRREEQRDPLAENRDGATTGIERATMRRAVDALRET